MLISVIFLLGLVWITSCPCLSKVREFDCPVLEFVSKIPKSTYSPISLLSWVYICETFKPRLSFTLITEKILELCVIPVFNCYLLLTEPGDVIVAEE